MKFHRWVAVLALVGAAAACAEAPEAGGEPGSEAAVESAGDSIVYVDVRTQAEYDAGHVEGAIHIPHTEMEARHEELAPYSDQRIVVYCRSGRRSGIAERILESEGFDNVINGGGLRDLRARGVPTTR